jgi:hypothetical protein
MNRERVRFEKKMHQSALHFCDYHGQRNEITSIKKPCINRAFLVFGGL